MLEDKYTIEISEEDSQEIFMSAALLRLLVAKLGDVEEVGDIYMKPDVQQEVMITSLAKRDEFGKELDSKTAVITYNRLSKTAGSDLMKWLGDHILAFFIDGVDKVQQSIMAQAKAMDSLTESLNGTEDLPNESPSVGSSEPNPAE